MTHRRLCAGSGAIQPEPAMIPEIPSNGMGKETPSGPGSLPQDDAQAQ